MFWLIASSIFHEILGDYFQDFFYEDVLMDIFGFLGVTYLYFVGVQNGYPFSSFPSEFYIKLFFGVE
jgi:hypothetical protein